ncbi:MAG: DUF4249 domain-containing protein [Bacteroidetes bacterium]|nr:DUF4249 domain-containing protein [Bacteroidota bacterium]
MPKSRSHILLIALLLVISYSCLEPYPPPTIDGGTSYLVVDGFLDSKTGSANVKLSRIIPLSSTDVAPAEASAIVKIERNDGTSFTLSERGAGNYEAKNILVDPSKKYRLYIKTNADEEFQSDFLSSKATPAIDSVTWKVYNNLEGVSVLVHTHDATNATRYYFWSYEETYEFDADYFSGLKLSGGTVNAIPLADQTYTCWRTLSSQQILVGSSSRLSVDAIANFPITIIPKRSQKLFKKYSILVRQRALSIDAYTFWENLKKTSEGLGSLFDPQPGKVVGNIYNVTNPSNPVLGYFDISEVTEKRLFISYSDLPDALQLSKPSSSCYIDTVFIAELPRFEGNTNSIVGSVQIGGDIIGYLFAPPYCSDCRYSQGTTQKPSFWE